MAKRRAHCYAASFGNDLARELIAKHLTTQGLVLDPFVGSGTTLIEATAAGHAFIGIDVDPIACLIAKSHGRSYSESWIQEATTYFNEKLSYLEGELLKRRPPVSLLRPGSTFHVNGSIATIPNREELDFWFSANQRALLASLVAFRDSLSTGKRRDVLSLAISSAIIRKWPNTISCAMDIDHSRPHRVRPAPRSIAQLFLLFRRVLKEVLSSLQSLPPSANGNVIHGDSGLLLKEMEPDIVDLVLTSPPYVGAIDYPRAHKFSEWWLSPDREFCKSSNYIGLRGGVAKLGACEGRAIQMAPRELAGMDWLRQSSNQKFAILCRYVSDMMDIVSGCFRVLKPGGHLVFVLADNSIGGRTVPVVAIVMELLVNAGFSTVERRIRHIEPQSRRYPFGFEGVMKHESIISAVR